MPSAYDCFQSQFCHFRRLVGPVSPAIDTARAHLSHLTTADPRVTATATLIGMMIIAAATFAFPLQVAVMAEHVTSTGTSMAADARAWVRFIGATPRSESCEDQVWPYIAPRCLGRPSTSGH